MQSKRETFTNAVSTQFSEWISTDDHITVSWVIQHPAANTAAYSVQVSNSSDQDVARALTVACDDLRVATVTPTTTATLLVVATGEARRVRLKIVGTVGTGTITTTATATTRK